MSEPIGSAPHFPQDVAFEVYLIAGLSVADVGMFVGEWNDGDWAVIAGKRNQFATVKLTPSMVIEPLGTMYHAEFLRHLDAVPPILPFGLQARDPANAVHVAQNEVSAKFLAGGERAVRG